MKNNPITTLLCISIPGLFLLFGFAHSPKKELVYKNLDLGWKIKVPEKWEVREKSQYQRENTKSSTYILDSLKDPSIKKATQFLLQFVKDESNRFDSFVEKAPQGSEINLEEKSSHLAELLLKNSKEKQAKVNIWQEEISISERKFYVVGLDLLHSPDHPPFSQKIYFGIAKADYLFGVSMLYETDENREIMEKAFYNSIFK